MVAALDAEDALMDKMVKEGPGRGSPGSGKAADKLKHPLTWAAIAGGLALTGPVASRPLCEPA